MQRGASSRAFRNELVETRQRCLSVLRFRQVAERRGMLGPHATWPPGSSVGEVLKVIPDDVHLLQKEPHVGRNRANALL